MKVPLGLGQGAILASEPPTQTLREPELLIKDSHQSTSPHCPLEDTPVQTQSILKPSDRLQNLQRTFQE